ncbi:MAG: GAF domain-containing protein [Proteobacteria bacterium]|nr:GAF domain-containing protein [Pseudomonadota bacterium]
MIKKSEYFKTLCNVSRAFGTTKEKEVLLDMIVKGAIDTMGGKAASLFLEDEKKGVFVTVSQAGLSENYIHSDFIHSKREVEGILEGGFLVFYDATSDLRLDNRDLKTAEGIKSILVVPVLVRDKAIGVLALYTAEHRNFDKDEVNFLSAMAEQGGMAIQNARLGERIRKNSELFHKLASGLNSCMDVHKILEIMAEDMCKALGMIGATVRIVNEKKNTIDLVYDYGLSSSFIEKCPAAIEDIEKDALSGTTIIINNVYIDDRVKHKEDMTREGIVSMLCVPVRSRDKVIGVMKMYFGVERQFPEDIIMLVNAIAHQGGLAIQNVSMQILLKQEAGLDVNGIAIDTSLFE